MRLDTVPGLWEGRWGRRGRFRGRVERRSGPRSASRFWAGLGRAPGCRPPPGSTTCHRPPVACAVAGPAVKEDRVGRTRPERAGRPAPAP